MYARHVRSVVRFFPRHFETEMNTAKNNGIAFWKFNFQISSANRIGISEAFGVWR